MTVDAGFTIIIMVAIIKMAVNSEQRCGLLSLFMIAFCKSCGVREGGMNPFLVPLIPFCQAAESPCTLNTP
jgi:hypothetical protein